MPARHYDAIVVGGGHNGLVAAGYLARAGLSVIVLERRGIVGGPCGRVEYFPGYIGAISNSPGALEPKIAEDLELERFGLHFNRPNPLLVAPFPDGRAFTAWREKERSVEEIKRFSAHDAVAYYAFFDYLEWFAHRLGISVFEPPPSLPDMLARLKTPEDEEAFGKIFLCSIKSLLDERLETEEIKSLIAALGVVSNFVSPSWPGTPYMLLQRPLSLASTVKSEFKNDPRRQPMRGSTGLPIGGMGAITDSMRRSIEASGATVRTESAVAAILVRHGAARGVALASGEEISGSIVLCNVNPKTVFLDMLDRSVVDPAVRTRFEKLKMTGSAFKIGLALDGIPRHRAARNDGEVRLLSAYQFRCQRRSKNASAGRSKNASRLTAGRPPRGAFLRPRLFLGLIRKTSG